MPTNITSCHFSPNGGCVATIVALLAAAVTSVDVLIFEFTDAAIATALIAARARGVNVRVVMDQRANYRPPSVKQELINAMVHVWTDHMHNIMHNKTLIIDGETLVTGSFNFTNNAENHNAENMLVISDPVIIPHYQTDFDLHLSHSTPAYAF